MVDNSIVSGFITALRNKFELKANKKDDITGDFTNDSTSFATVRSIKSYIASVISGKADTSDIPTKTSDLTNDSGFLTSHNPVDSALSSTSTNAVQNKKVKEALDLKANASSVPKKTSDLTNDGDGTNVFVKNNDSRLSDSRTPTSHTHGNITNDGKVGTASGKPLITGTGGVVQAGSFGSSSGTFAEGNHTHSGYLTNQDITGKADKTGGAGQITDTNAHTNLGTSANATQAAINSAIDTKIGSLLAVDLIEIVSTKPTASASTMGKFYLVPEEDAETENAFEWFFTVVNNGSYKWERIDGPKIDLSGYVKTNDSRLSDARTPTSHVHGSITNDGKIGTASGKIITTGSGGVLQASASITRSMISDFSHTHDYTTTSDVDSEIEAYLTALTTALNS